MCGPIFTDLSKLKQVQSHSEVQLLYMIGVDALYIWQVIDDVIRSMMQRTM